jgi:hypothetical protein
MIVINWRNLQTVHNKSQEVFEKSGILIPTVFPFWGKKMLFSCGIVASPIQNCFGGGLPKVKRRIAKGSS